MAEIEASEPAEVDEVEAVDQGDPAEPEEQAEQPQESDQSDDQSDELDESEDSEAEGESEASEEGDLVDQAEDYSPGVRPLRAEVAALAILAAKRMHNRFADENDNEAERQSDGSVRLSIKVSNEVGHRRVWVRVPDKIELEIVDGPGELISPE